MHSPASGPVQLAVPVLDDDGALPRVNLAHDGGTDGNAEGIRGHSSWLWKALPRFHVAHSRREQRRCFSMSPCAPGRDEYERSHKTRAHATTLGRAAAGLHPEEKGHHCCF